MSRALLVVSMMCLCWGCQRGPVAGEATPAIASPAEVAAVAAELAGSSCQQASRFLEQALGVQASEKLTAEFYQQEASQQHLQQGGAA